VRPDRNSARMQTRISRREMLSGGVAVAGGLLIGIDFGLARADEPTATGARMKAYIHVAPTDRITVHDACG